MAGRNLRATPAPPATTAPRPRVFPRYLSKAEPCAEAPPLSLSAQSFAGSSAPRFRHQLPLTLPFRLQPRRRPLGLRRAPRRHRRRRVSDAAARSERRHAESRGDQRWFPLRRGQRSDDRPRDLRGGITRAPATATNAPSIPSARITAAAKRSNTSTPIRTGAAFSPATPSASITAWSAGTPTCCRTRRKPSASRTSTSHQETGAGVLQAQPAPTRGFFCVPDRPAGRRSRRVRRAVLLRVVVLAKS